MSEQTSQTCCEEYAAAAAIHRRTAVKAVLGSGAAVGLTLGTDSWGSVSYGAGIGGNVVVALVLGGAIDGISVVVPHADPIYAKARPTLALNPASLLAKDATFGMHPNLAPLMPMWNAGKLAFAHATGLPVRNRSHFDALELVEDADPGSAERCGWLNRLLGSSGATGTFGGVSVGSSVPTTTLAGSTPTLSMKALTDLRIPGAIAAIDNSTWSARRLAQLDTVWRDVKTRLGTDVRSTLAAVAASKTLTGMTTSVTYPNSPIGSALKDVAKLIKADIGVRAVTVDRDGWDFHAAQGSVSGAFATQLSDLAKSLAAFFTDLGSHGGRVTLVTLSEFGRRTMENGARGVDHGWGNVMMLAGAGVKGGKYYAKWPGLGSSVAVDNDLEVTTDYRSVLWEIIERRYPNTSPAAVFPQFTPSKLGVMS